MDVKRFALAGMCSFLAALSAHGQQITPPAPIKESPTASVGSPIAVAPDAAPIPASGYDVPGVTNWIRRDNGVCCNGPVGGNTQVGCELYLRTGASLPVGAGTLLSRNLTTGFTVQGGARSLFFNTDYSKAWVVDTHIGNTQNSGVPQQDSETIFYNGLVPSNTAANGTTSVTDFPLTIRSVNRTYVGLGLGREWFFGSAQTPGPQWRIGVDAGARYGTMKMDYREITRRGDVIGALYTGGHLLYEFPCYGNIVNIGLRTEYSYTWSDVTQRASDLSEINVLFSGGIRF